MMKNRVALHVRIGLAAAIVMLAGCGGGTRNEIVPVEGQIRFTNGKPLPVGTRVVLSPVQGGVGSAMGVTSDDGSFQVKHANGAMGAEVGKYVVQLLPPEAAPGDFERVVPKAFRAGEKLTAEVKQGMGRLELKVAAR